MFCKNCGKEIADGARFCASCGASVESEPKTNGPINNVASDHEMAVRSDASRSILIFGILSVAFSSSFWLAIVGWILGGICKNKVREYEAHFGPVSGMAKVGKYLGVGGFIGGIVFTILSSLYWVWYGLYIFLIAFASML